MKKLLAGAAAAAAILAPGIASADTNAVIGLQYTNAEFDGGGDLDNYGFNGAFSHELSNGGVLQFDGEWSRTDAGGCCFGTSYGAVHYGVRNDSYSFGGFAGLTDMMYSGLGVGIEGQLFFGNLNVNGALGVVDFDDADLETFGGQVDVAYFFTRNLALTGLVGQSEIDGGGSDLDVTTWGIGGEWRMSASPISFVAGYRNLDTDFGDADSWSIGVNFDFGTGSVQERTRSGTNFGGAEAIFGGSGLLLIP